jgi:RNA polymerase sigma-70 factor (ECF subfamily)
MTAGFRLCEALAAGLPGVATSASLERILADILDAAHRSWPAVTVDDAHFLAYLASRLGSADMEAALRRFHGDDLYLACACAAGQPTALALFDEHLLGPLGRTLAARMSAVPSLVDEVKQLLRRKLFLPSEHAPARIAEYSGKGSLQRWLQVVATRTTLDLVRSARPERTLDSELDAGILVKLTDPELAAIRRQNRQHLEAAFRAALAGLTSRERNLLRFHFVDGLTFEKIGAIYHVHRATVGRRIEEARAAVLEGMRRELRARAGLSTTELDSLMGGIPSQLELSIIELLRQRT